MVEKILRVFSAAALYVSLRYVLHISGLDVVDRAISIPLLLLSFIDLGGWYWRAVYGVVAVLIGVGASLDWPEPSFQAWATLSYTFLTGLGASLLMGKHWIFLSAALVSIHWILFGEPRWISVVNYLLTVGIYTFLRREG